MAVIAFLCRWIGRLRWALFGAALVGFGLGLHLYLPPVPRWSIAEEPGERFRRDGAFFNVSPDGSSVHLAVFDYGPREMRVWDTTTRRLRGRYAGGDAVLSGHAVRSRDFRYLAVPRKDGTIAFADTVEGREWTITLPIQMPADVPEEWHWIDAATVDPSLHQADYFLFREGWRGDSASGKLHVVVPSSGELIATLDASVHWMHYQMTTKNDLLLYFAEPRDGLKRPLLTVWDMKERKMVRTIPEIDVLDDLFLLAPDGKGLLVVNKAQGWVRWDLRAGTRQVLGLSNFYEFRRSTDGCVHVFSKFDVVELLDNHLQKLTTIKIDATPPYPFVSPDCRMIGVISDESISVWETATGKRLWEKDMMIGLDTGKPKFSRDSQFLVCECLGELKILRSATGEVCPAPSVRQNGAKVSLDHFHITGKNVVLSADISSLDKKESTLKKWLGEWWPFPSNKDSYVMVVADIATGRELLRVHGQYILPVSEGSDDQTVIVLRAVTEDKAAVEAWDVPARPRWGWVAGAPAGLGLVVVSFTRWRSRRKRRQAMPPAIVAALPAVT